MCANCVFASVELEQSDGAIYCGIVLVLLGIWAVNESHIVTMFYQSFHLIDDRGANRSVLHGSHACMKASTSARHWQIPCVLNGFVSH